MSLPGTVAFNVIYRCLRKSFCNNLVHSKLKSELPLRNCEHLHVKRLGVNPSKVVNLPIMSPGAEDMEYLNNR